MLFACFCEETSNKIRMKASSLVLHLDNVGAKNSNYSLLLGSQQHSQCPGNRQTHTSCYAPRLSFIQENQTRPTHLSKGERGCLASIQQG